jgi:hypothetical protein
MAKRKPTRKTRATKQPLQLGEYGPVVVCEGKYKGRVGYYDDDADEDINFAIVYFDTPFYLFTMLTKEIFPAKRVQPSFIEPMQVAPVRELRDGGTWSYEAKLDGYRCLVAKRSRCCALVPPWHRLYHAVNMETANLPSTQAEHSRCLTPKACRLTVIALLLFSCTSTIEVIERDLVAKHFGFLQEGTTTRREVLGRLGHPTSEYEEGRIVTYHLKEHPTRGFQVVSFREEGRLFNLVLSFGSNEVLTRCTLIRVQ